MSEEVSQPSDKQDEVEKLKQELAICQKKSEEYLNGWKRAKADYINLKRDTEKEKEDSLEGLESAKGFIRSQLLKMLHLRAIPELTFKHDDTAEYATNIQKLLNEIHHGRSS